MHKENYYSFRLTCLKLNKYLICDCDGCVWWIIFELRGMWHFKVSFVDVYWIFIFYSIFGIQAAVPIFYMYFSDLIWPSLCHGDTNVSLWSCLLSFVFQSLVSIALLSRVILSPSTWFFYGMNMTRVRYGGPNAMTINVLLNSRLFRLARVSRIIAMTCHVQVSLAGIFFYGLNLACVSPRIFERVAYAKLGYSYCSHHSFLKNFKMNKVRFGSESPN